MADRVTRLGLRGHAGRSAALAQLLHEECVQLLELFKKRETLPSSSSVAKEYLVSIPPLVPQLSDGEKISILHAALKECRRLLEDVITREDAEFPDLESEYKRQRKSVRDRLGHLLVSTERLLVDGKRFDAAVKEKQTFETEIDGHFICDCVKGAGWQLDLWFEDVDSESSAGPCALDRPNIRNSPLSASGAGESTNHNVPKNKKTCWKKKEVRQTKRVQRQEEEDV